MNKADPYCSDTLGDFAPDPKVTNKSRIGFSRSAILEIPEGCAQTWVDPEKRTQNKVWGPARFTEYKFVSLKNGDIGFGRELHPLDGSTIVPLI